MVPKGWKRVAIKDVCESIIDCVNKTAPIVDYETPFKMIRTTNVRDGRVNTEDVRYVTEVTYQQWVRRGKPQDGDIIFTREAPVGEIGILENANGIFLGQRTMMYRADHSRSDNYYLFYSLSSSFCKKQIEDFSNGGTVAHMRVPDCGDILINLPPLSEQKKIAQILSTWDKAITATEQLLTNSQQQKKALMQQLLTGKKRLLDKNGVRFSGEWKKFTLSSFGRSIRGVSYKPENISEKEGKDTIRLLRSTNIQNGNLNNKDLVILPKELVKPTQILKKGDLAICMANGSKALVGKSAPFEGNDITYTVGAFCAIFRSSSEKNSNFVKFLFESNQYQSQLLLILAGSSINNLKGTDIESIKIFAPMCLEEQQKIATVLSTADKEITALKQKIDVLNQEKKALMQQLLTGKRRVNIEEIA